MNAKQVAGYSGTPLVKKLGLKDGFSALVEGHPDDYFELLGPTPDVHWKTRAAGVLDFIHLFVTKQKRLQQRLPLLQSKLAKSGSLWISWPKKSSGKETEVAEADVRAAGLDIGLVDVKICAVDETWSGLKFVYRKEDR